MPKKIYYSQPLKYQWNDLYGAQKKNAPYLSGEQIFKILKRNLLLVPETTYEIAVSKQLAISGLELWWRDFKAEVMHIYFLDKQLRDFLMEMPLSDLEGIKKFLHSQGTTADVWHYYSNGKSTQVTYQFALHIPYDSVGYAFSLSLEEEGSIDLYYSLGENGGRMSNKFYADVLKRQDDISRTHANIFRLAINTIAYMKCFPDCVSEGVPQNLFVKNGEPLNKLSVSLQLAEKIKDTDHPTRSRIPHFRRGHFRLLRSDRYAHKKGELIFIADTMVKGKAKTVATSPEIDKFRDDSTED